MRLCYKVFNKMEFVQSNVFAEFNKKQLGTVLNGLRALCMNEAESLTFSCINDERVALRLLCDRMILFRGDKKYEFFMEGYVLRTLEGFVLEELIGSAPAGYQVTVEVVSPINGKRCGVVFSASGDM